MKKSPLHQSWAYGPSVYIGMISGEDRCKTILAQRLVITFWTLGCLWLSAAQGYAEDALTIDNRPFRLMRAAMCETIEEYEPKFVAVTFSINIGKISCYTSFDGVTDTTYVSHKWYRRGELVTAKRLTLKPPSWATYSSIQLREADKGPWRVEVLDAQDRLIRTLRFSVTD
jgi:hypothetical protein